MTLAQKELIVSELRKMLENTSQNKLANRAGISAGYMSLIMNKKWGNIAHETWLKVALNLRISLDETWVTAETSNYLQFQELIAATQRRSMSIGIAGTAGFGKSEAFTNYARNNKNAFYLQCDDFWRKKQFLENFLRALGEDPTGLTNSEMCEDIIVRLKSIENPIVLFDEMDKLQEAQIMFFISLYNKLDGHCAFVVSGAPYFEFRVQKNAKRDKRGYQEFYSRIGRRFIKPQPATLKDVAMICSVNGITDKDEHYRIYKVSENDLRRVKREVIKLKELKA